MMRTRVMSLAAVLLGLLAAPLLADPMADQMRKVRDTVAPSTVVVSYYVERDDGGRADARVLGTVVGQGNLILFSSAAIPSQIPLTQFHDFKVIVTKGDDLKTFDAEYLGKDEQAQVAFVRITDPQAPALPVLAFDEKVKIEVGDAVLSFAMLGEPDGYERVVQSTRISGRIEQPVTTYVTANGLGAPGTPVITLDGKRVGIIGLVRLNRGTNARPNWATVAVVWPTERFIERLKNPPKGGAMVKRPWIGIQTLTAVTKDLAEYFKLGDRRGVIIGQVIPQSPAEKAGLKPEDIILAVNGKDLKGTEGQLVENFGNDIRERKIGEVLTFDVWRAGKIEPLKVTLAEQPPGPAEAERYRIASFGLTVREMVLQDRLTRELPPTETGVVVAFVDSAGWAQDGGLRTDDIIKKVQDKDAPTLADFKKVFQEETKNKPKEIVLFVLRGTKETQLVRLEPRWDAAKPKTDAAPEKKPEGAPAK
jgi:S1-C subfamily serine protease